MANGPLGPVPAPPTIISLGAALLREGVVIPSFAQFAVTGEDNLRVITVGAVGGITCEVHGRFLDVASSTVLPFRYTIPVSSNRTVTQQDFPLGLGYILNLTAFTTGTPAPILGQAYVLVQLIRGLGGATVLLSTLFAGYITNTQPLGWPGSAITPSTVGEPTLRAITGTTPAPGAEVSETVPSGARWEVVAFRAIFATSGAAGTRFPVLLAPAPASSGFLSIQPVGQAPGTQADYTWAPGMALTNEATAIRFQQSLPTRTLLLAGHKITTSTLNLAAGDQWGPVQYTVREWLEVS